MKRGGEFEERNKIICFFRRKLYREKFYRKIDSIGIDGQITCGSFGKGIKKRVKYIYVYNPFDEKRK